MDKCRQLFTAIKDFLGNISIFLLNKASYCGCVHAVLMHLLIFLRFSPNYKDIRGQSIVHHAARRGRVKHFEILGDVDYNAPDNDGNTPLHIAAANNRYEVAAFLCQYGGIRDLKNNAGKCAIHIASENGFSEVVTCIIKVGLDVNIQDNDMYTPLMLACRYGHTHVVKELLRKNASVTAQDATGNSPLIMASLEGHTDIISHLITFNADCNHRNSGGWTALMYAAGKGHDSAVAALQRHCNDLDRALIIASSQGHGNIIATLLDRGANINVQDEDGLSPLSAALTGKHDKVVDQLLENHANVNIKGQQGRTPLFIAAECGEKNTIRKLHKYQADIDAQDEDGITPVHVADTKETVDLLIVLKGREILHKQDKQGISACLKNRLKEKDLIDDIESQLNALALKQTNEKNVVSVKITTLVIVIMGLLVLFGVMALCLVYFVETESISRTLSYAAKKVDEDGQTIFMIACKHGYINIVKDVLKQSENVVNKKDKDGNTAIHFACIGGYDDVVKHLLNHNANVNVQNDFGRTPLMEASIVNYPNIVANLIKNGADVNISDSDNSTALSLSSMHGHSRIVKILIDNGAFVDTVCKYGTPLLIAVLIKNKDCVLELIKGKADINYQDEKGFTALMIASDMGNIDMLHLLLQAGADTELISMSGLTTSLMIAANYGHSQAVNVLVQNGANVEGVNYTYTTPLILSSGKGHLETVKILLKYNASVHTKNLNGESALMKATLHSHLDIVRIILNMNPDINERKSMLYSGISPNNFKTNYTLLMIASQKGNYNISKELLKFGADPNLRGYDGMSAVLLAAKYGHRDIVTLLIDHKGDLSQQDNLGRTALQWASINGWNDIVRVIVDSHQHVDDVDQDGRTALLHTSMGEHTEITNILLEHGSDPNRCDKGGECPLCQAVLRNNSALVFKLLLKEADINRVCPVQFQTKHILDKDTELIISYKRQNLTVLMAAAFNNLTDMVKTLAKFNPNIDETDSEGNNALMYASMEGNLDIIDIILRKKANIDKQNSIGSTALMIAVEHKRLNAVNMLLNKGADMKVKRQMDNATALGIAITKGNTKMVKNLLTSDIDQPCLGKMTGLMLASVFGYEKIVKVLLQKGADPNMSSCKLTSILLGIYNGHPKVVKLLLGRGASPETMEKDILSPLIEAVRLNNTAIVNILLDHGANVNIRTTKNETVLMIATQNNNRNMIAKLIEKGAHLNAKDNNGQTPLIYAVSHNNTFAVKALLKAGLDPNIEFCNRTSALTHAVQFGNSDIVKSLLEYGATTNHHCHYQIIKYAAMKGLTNILRMILDNISTEISNSLGFMEDVLILAIHHVKFHTAKLLIDHILDTVMINGNMKAMVLMQAAKVGDSEILKMVLESRRDALHWSQVDLSEAFIISAENDHVNAMSMLLDWGANINHQMAPHGTSALMQGSLLGHAEVVVFLLQNGADMTLRNMCEYDAYLNAYSQGHKHIVELLVAHKNKIQTCPFQKPLKDSDIRHHN